MRTRKSMKTLMTYMIEVDQHKKLKQLAIDSGVPMSRHIRQAISAYLDRADIIRDRAIKQVWESEVCRGSNKYRNTSSKDRK